MKKRKKHRRYHKKIQVRRMIPALILTAVIVYSCIRIGIYFVRMHNVKVENTQLTALYESDQTDNSLNNAQVGNTLLPEKNNSLDEKSEIYSANDAEGNEYSDRTTDEKTDTRFRVVAEDINSDMLELYNKNNDLKAWLRITDVVNCPVVYRDNEYYLNHDYYGRKSEYGTLFLDEITPFEENLPSLLIHGHNMHNGEMFGLVSHYKSQNFAAEHPWMKFSTLYDMEYYVLIGAMECDLSDDNAAAYYSCAVYNPAYEWDFKYFSDLWDSCALYRTDAEMNETDALITLSTCLEDDVRLLVLFRKVRTDETLEEMETMFPEAQLPASTSVADIVSK